MMWEFHDSNVNCFGDIWRTDKLINFSSRNRWTQALFVCAYYGLRPLLVFYFRGRKIRGWNISRNSIRSGYLYRGRETSHIIQIREYRHNFLHSNKYVLYSIKPYMENCRPISFTNHE